MNVREGKVTLVHSSCGGTTAVVYRLRDEILACCLLLVLDWYWEAVPNGG